MELPAQIDMVAFGWALQEGKLRAVVRPGAYRLEVGGRFIVPLTRRDGDWSLLAGDSVFVVTSDGHIQPPKVPETDDGTAAWDLAGLDLAEVEAVLDGTPLDKDAARYMHLEPYERGRAVIEERAR